LLCLQVVGSDLVSLLLLNLAASDNIDALVEECETEASPCSANRPQLRDLDLLTCPIEAAKPRNWHVWKETETVEALLDLNHSTCPFNHDSVALDRAVFLSICII